MANQHISTIIPAYNAAPTLRAAIESVLEQANAPKLQLIVVDDGSTDATEAIARSYPEVEYFRQDNRGAAAARNLGMQKCIGEYVCFLDADDYFHCEKLAKQFQLLDRSPELDAVFGHVAEFEDCALDRHRKPMQAAPGYHAGTMMTRKSFFHRVGPFDETLDVAEFVDWYSRAVTLEMKHIMLPDIVLYRRLHQNNQGLRKLSSVGDYAKVLKAHLDRSRRAQCSPIN